MGTKIDEITKILSKIDFLESQGITYGAERIGPPVIQIMAGFKKKQPKVGFVSSHNLIAGDPILSAP